MLTSNNCLFICEAGVVGKRGKGEGGGAETVLLTRFSHQVPQEPARVGLDWTSDLLSRKQHPESLSQYQHLPGPALVGSWDQELAIKPRCPVEGPRHVDR